MYFGSSSDIRYERLWGGSTSIAPAPLPSTTVALKFTLATPSVLAEKIGTGPWTAASAQNGQLNLSLPAGVNNFAIAYYCPGTSGQLSINEESVFEATVQDNITRVAGCSSPFTLTKGSVTGSVDASAIFGVAKISVYAPFGQQLLAGATGNFDFQAQQGTDDIAFVAADASANVLAVKVLPLQSVPGAVNNGSVVTFSPTDATTSDTVSVTNIPAGFNPPLIPGIATYFTAKGTSFVINNTVGTEYSVVPSSEVQAGDHYRFFADAFDQHSSILSSMTVTSATAISLAMPTPLPYAPPTPAPFPNFSLSYSGTAGAKGYFVNLSWPTTQGVGNFTSVYATAAYEAGTTSLAVPDLSGISGFPSPASSGTLVRWSVEVTGGTYSTPPQPEGVGSLWLATNSGIYTEP